MVVKPLLSQFDLVFFSPFNFSNPLPHDHPAIKSYKTNIKFVFFFFLQDVLLQK